MAGNEYVVYGLRVVSNVALEELESAAPRDLRPWQLSEIVTIDVGPATGVIIHADPGFTGDAGRLVYLEPSVAVFALQAGASIDVQIWPGADWRVVRFYLYARALPAILYQRRVLPLHASAIVSTRAAVGLIGESGAGKSSLAAALVARGASLLSDDLLPLRETDVGDYLASRGIARFHLTNEAALTTGRAPPAPEDRFGGFGKHYYGAAAAAESVYPLRALYFLEWDETAPAASVTQTSPFEALSSMRDHTYYHSLIAHLGLERRFLDFFSNLVKNVEIYTFRRPRDLAALDSQAAALQSHFIPILARHDPGSSEATGGGP